MVFTHDAETRMTTPHRPKAKRFSFMRKAAAAAALIVLADHLFYGERVGATLGLFALAWAAALIGTVPVLRRKGPALLALAAAAGFAVILIDDPSLLAVMLFWVAISSAALLPRRRFRHAGAWALSLGAHALDGLAAPIRDVLRLRRLRAGPAAVVGSVLALPVLGGAIFLALFAGANPLIGNALAEVRLPSAATTVFHLVFWTVVLGLVWPAFRPRAKPPRAGGAAAATFVWDVPVSTLVLSLWTFNLIFAVENGLDLAFLWSGAELPAGVTLADYAHRGAYTLIATALVAGLFVLIALRPGSAGARSPLARRLVVVWVAQNLLLVASSVRRTLDYVDAYSMTVWRLSALAWMGLVAVGLVLICWRLLAGRSAAWLINGNAAATAIVLTAASIVDLGATAAAWNVRHARRADALDLCYLGQLGPSALLALVTLERNAGPELRDRVAWVRAGAMREVAERQADPHGWTWRNARRLAAARHLLGPTPTRPAPASHGRRCDGSLVPPPPAPRPPALPPAPPPLTAGPQG